MLLVPTAKIAEVERVTPRTILNRYNGVLVPYKGKGRGGKVYGVPLDVLDKAVFQKHALNIPDNLILSQTLCKNISNLTQTRNEKNGQGVDKGVDSDFFYVTQDKTVINKTKKLYLTKEKVSTILGYKSPENVLKKASREDWEYIEIDWNGGLKRFYLLSCLPIDAQFQLSLELQTLYSHQAAAEGDAGAYANASDKERAIADQRASTLQEWYSYLAKASKRKAYTKKKATLEFVNIYKAQYPDHECSRATLHRWDAEFRAHGLDGLVPSYYKPTGSRAFFTPEAWNLAKDLYLDTRRRDMYDVYMIVKHQAVERGWVVPSYATVRRQLLALADDIVKRLRYGHKGFVDAGFPSILRDRTSISPGQLYVCDARYADVSFADGKKGQRIWVFAWVDAATYKCVGRSWGKSGADVDAVLDAFYMAALEHMPEMVYLDNGSDMIAAGKQTKKTAELPESLIAPLQILFGKDGVNYSKVKNPQSKIIERKPFRDMARLCDPSFPGYTSANIYDRGEHWEIEQKAGAFFSEDTVKSLINFWLFEKYNNWAPNPKDARSPNEKWADYFAEKAKRIADPERLRHVLLPLKKHQKGYKWKVRRHGIEFTPDGYNKPRWYWSEWLQNLPAKTEVLVKAHANDPSRIWIYDIKGKPLGELPELRWQDMPYMNADKEELQDFFKTRGDREKEILEQKKQWRESHGVDLSTVDMMSRADHHAPPTETIDPETGEIVEKTELVDINVDIPPSNEQLLSEMQQLKEREAELEERMSRLKPKKEKKPDDDVFARLHKAVGNE